jgi:hypothetical protein
MVENLKEKIEMVENLKEKFEMVENFENLSYWDAKNAKKKFLEFLGKFLR